MATSVSAVSRRKMSELILSIEGPKLSDSEVRAYNKFIAASVKAYCGLVDGKVLCIWGLIPPTIVSDQAYLWLYTTPDVEARQFILVRRSQIEVKKMLEEFPKIVGHCEVEAKRSIRWLKWLGAEFGKAADGLIPFVIKRAE